MRLWATKVSEQPIRRNHNWEGTAQTQWILFRRLLRDLGEGRYVVAVVSTDGSGSTDFQGLVELRGGEKPGSVRVLFNPQHVTGAVQPDLPFDEDTPADWY
jgi:hypothetical protein